MERECFGNDEKWRIKIMNKIGMEKKAITIIRNFLKDYKLDSLDDLKTFSFWKIKDDKDYNGYPGEYDGDRTNIVYAIDYLLYKDSIPNLTLRGFPCSNGKEGNYSGETINTFNTLFGGTEKYRNYAKRNFSLDQWKEIYDLDNPDCFYYNYQKLGNFMLLPCKTICNTSINSYKGIHPIWKDYSYPFMLNLKASYDINDFNNDLDKEYYELALLRRKNDFFFSKINFERFIEIFDLENFSDLKLEQYLRRTELCVNNTNIAIDYVHKANKFIEARTKEMVSKLKEKLK